MYRDLRGLIGLPEERDLVYRESLGYFAVHVLGEHSQRPDRLRFGRGDPLAQSVLAKIVHQKADGAAVHPVDPLAGVHEAVERLQHEPVAAQRHDRLGFLDRLLPIKGRQYRRGFARFRRVR